MANTKIQSEQIADSAITTDRIAADAITTAKIADNVALGGSPTTTTQSASDNSTKIATTEYVTSAISSLIDSAPSTLNTLNEIAAALNDDANFNTTVTNSIAAKLPLAGGTMTGSLGVGVSATSSIAAYMLTGTANHLAAQIENTNTTTSQALVVKGGNDANDYAASFRQRDNTEILKLRGDGAAIFSGTISSGAITSSGNISLGGADGDNAVLSLTANTGNWVFTNVQSNRNLEISDSDGTGTVLTLDTSGNAAFAGTISSGGNPVVLGGVSNAVNLTITGVMRANNGYKVGSSTVIDSSRNLTNIGTISSNVHTITNTGTSGDTRQFFIDAEDAEYDFRTNSTSGYTTTFNMDNTGLEIGHNSGSRNFALKTNSTDRIVIASGGGVSFESNNLTSVGAMSIGHSNTPSNEIDLRSSSHGVISVLAGTNSSASLRLKNDNVDWDVNCQTNDHFAIYQHSLGGSGTNIQPFTITPAGLVGINKTNPSITMEVDSNSAATGDDALSVANRGVTSIGHTTGMRFQYNTAIPAAIRTVLKNTSSGAGSLELQTSGNATAGNLTSRLKVHEQGHVSINSTQTATEKTGGLVVVGPIVTQGRYGSGQIGRNQSNGADFSSLSSTWATHSSSGLNGSYSGAVRFTVPSAAGTAGNGYGSFSGIIQLSGYNGPAMTASFHAYQNQALYGATSSILSNNGSFSISLAINGAHGWYIEVDIPGMTHPNAYIQLSHGGTTSSSAIWDLNECFWTWS